MKKIDSIINNLEKNKNITTKDLDVLKTINEDELEYLIMSDSEHKDYLIKAYFTVYNEKVVNKAYLFNPALLENSFSKVWVESILSESTENIIFAYIPTKLFSTQILSYIRNGIKNNYSSDVLNDFENQIEKIIYTLGNEENFILSKVYLLNKKYTNDQILNDFKNNKEVYEDMILILDIIKESFIIVNKYKDKSYYSLDELYNMETYYFLKEIFPNSIFKELEKNSPIQENKLNDNTEKNINESYDNISIDSALKRESTEKNDKKDLIKENKKTLNKKNKNIKLKQINIDTLKKRGNFKVIFFSLLMALIAIIISIKMIKTEIEKDSKTINSTIIEKSDIPVEVKNKNNEN